MKAKPKKKAAKKVAKKKTAKKAIKRTPKKVAPNEKKIEELLPDDALAATPVEVETEETLASLGEEE